ncbi:MAG TPA: GNAT family N-acetyltransferase [Rhodocyclaceae bacterium]|nr:GNAT family N-acetyltransferase [Rhodocyclaceae bacterium]
MKTIIDFATEADPPALADLLHELFTLESDFQPEREKQLRGLRLILDMPQIGRPFVLRVDEQVAGLGRLLMEHGCAWAKDQGMTRVTLLADRDNQKALAFYDKLGFQESALVVRRKPL